MPGLLIIAKILSSSLISLSSIVYFQPCLRWPSKKEEPKKESNAKENLFVRLGGDWFSNACKKS